MTRLPLGPTDLAADDACSGAFRLKTMPQMSMKRCDLRVPAVAGEHALAPRMRDVVAAAPGLEGRWLVVDDSPSDRRLMEEVLVEGRRRP